jgi:hypothetical protein
VLLEAPGSSRCACSGSTGLRIAPGMAAAASGSMDPTLDACCAKDARQSAADAERNRVLRVEAAKRGLDFAPHRRFSPARTLGLAGSGEIRINAGGGAQATAGSSDDDRDDDDDDDDLAFLDELDAEDDDAAELATLREGRLAELRASAGTGRAAETRTSLVPQFGSIGLVAEGQLLQLVGSSDRVVCLLGLAAPGNAASFAAGGAKGADAVVAGVQTHMQRLSQSWKGTQFVCAPVASADSPLLATVRAPRVLPALVCFREGVVADKATHPHQLHQFINMGDIGFAILEAWLTQSDLLAKTPRAVSERRRAAAAQAAAADRATEVDAEDEVTERSRSLVIDTAERASAQAELRAALGDERAPSTPRVPLAPGAWAQSACDDPKCRLGFSHEHLFD